MTTPPTDDLRARLIADLRTINEQQKNAVTAADYMAAGEKALRLIPDIIAALSALPAGGDPVAWQVRYLCPEEGPSTWQPCEAEHVHIYRARGDRYEIRALGALTTPPPDAAVGAQGDGRLYTQADLNAEYTRGRCDGFDAAAPAAGKGVDDASERQPDGYAYRYADGFIRHNGGRDHNGMRPTETIPFYYGSAPALTRQPEGKGVDGLPAKWRATSGAIAKPYGFVTEHVLGKAQALDACADELEAALTRQPVAGDGWVKTSERMPPAGVFVYTLIRKPKAKGGFAHSFGIWDRDNDSMPDAAQFRKEFAYWSPMPPLPAAPTGPAQGDGWQPIETAPKDGSFFLTANFRDPFDDAGEYEISRYDPLYWERYEEVGDGLYRKGKRLIRDFASDNFERMTHWLPLPAAPAATPTDGGEGK